MMAEKGNESFQGTKKIPQGRKSLSRSRIQGHEIQKSHFKKLHNY